MSESSKVNSSGQISTFERRNPANKILKVIEEKRKQVAYVNGEGDTKKFVNTLPTKIEDIFEIPQNSLPQNNLQKYKEKYNQKIDASKLQKIDIGKNITGSTIKISFSHNSKNQETNTQILVFKGYSVAVDRITETVLLKFKNTESGIVLAWNGAYSENGDIILWKKDIYSVYRFFGAAQLENIENPILY